MTLEEAKDKIEYFKALEKGWHFGEGVPAKPETAGSALFLLHFAGNKTFDHFNAFPGIDGSVMLSIYKNGYEFECNFHGENSATLYIEQYKDSENVLLPESIEMHYSENNSLAEILEKLYAFKILYGYDKLV